MRLYQTAAKYVDDGGLPAPPDERAAIGRLLVATLARDSRLKRWAVSEANAWARVEEIRRDQPKTGEKDL